MPAAEQVTPKWSKYMKDKSNALMNTIENRVQNSVSMSDIKQPTTLQDDLREEWTRYNKHKLYQSNNVVGSLPTDCGTLR